MNNVQGERLIHCDGGLGRTGTMAASLLLEMGSDPKEAVRAVRRARHGAIENPVQEKYVHNQTPFAKEGLLSFLLFLFFSRHAC